MKRIAFLCMTFLVALVCTGYGQQSAQAPQADTDTGVVADRPRRRQRRHDFPRHPLRRVARRRVALAAPATRREMGRHPSGDRVRDRPVRASRDPIAPPWQTNPWPDTPPPHYRINRPFILVRQTTFEYLETRTRESGIEKCPGHVRPGIGHGEGRSSDVEQNQREIACRKRSVKGAHEERPREQERGADREDRAKDSHPSALTEDRKEKWYSDRCTGQKTQTREQHHCPVSLRPLPTTRPRQQKG